MSCNIDTTLYTKAYKLYLNRDVFDADQYWSVEISPDRTQYHNILISRKRPDRVLCSIYKFNDVCSNDVNKIKLSGNMVSITKTDNNLLVEISGYVYNIESMDDILLLDDMFMDSLSRYDN